MRHQNGNGNSGGNPIEAEVIPPGQTTMPGGNGNAPAPITGQAYPMQRQLFNQPGQMVISQKVVFGIGGFVLGAGVMYWLLRSMKEKR